VRICFISRWNEGGWFAWLCKQAGHQVTLVVEEESCAEALAGLIESQPTASDPSDYDLIVYDASGMGEDADESRTITPTIGGSKLADTLEHDRVAGLEFMERCGIRVPAWEHFTEVSDGIRYIKQHKKPMVFKPCGKDADTSCTYVSSSPEDMLQYIDLLYRQNPQKEFVLQEVVKGTEVSMEMWMNESGYYAINATLEAKKLMAGNIGPATGCAGNVVWMMGQGEPNVFQRGLKKVFEPLRELGYVGMIDLNAIVTDEDVFGLEWTPRFGYEGTCNLTRLLPIEFGEFLGRVAENAPMPTLTPKEGFCASIRIGIPPYPLPKLPDKMYRKGVPIGGLDPEKLEHFFARDVRVSENDEDRLETAGVDGWIGSVLAVGPTIHDAFSAANEMVKSLKIPDMMYRNDLESIFVRRYLELREGGWLKSTHSR
jgi:phosphoribosylamine-glycine ligase